MSDKVFTRAEVAKHKTWNNDQKDVWCIYDGKVLDITSFIAEHPGGEDVLLDLAGADITQEYKNIGHSDYANELLNRLKIGVLSPEEAKAPAKKEGTETKRANSSSSDSSPRTTLIIPIGIILLSILIYVYYGN